MGVRAQELLQASLPGSFLPLPHPWAPWLGPGPPDLPLPPERLVYEVRQKCRNIEGECGAGARPAPRVWAGLGLCPSLPGPLRAEGHRGVWGQLQGRKARFVPPFSLAGSCDVAVAHPGWWEGSPGHCPEFWAGAGGLWESCPLLPGLVLSSGVTPTWGECVQGLGCPHAGVGCQGDVSPSPPDICISCGSLNVTLEHPLFIGGMCQNCKVWCGAGPGEAHSVPGPVPVSWGPQ